VSTAWLERAFIELAGKGCEEAQDILRRWMATRQLTMPDNQYLADRLTAAYLERDAKRSANMALLTKANMPHRTKTGKLVLPGESKPQKGKTGNLPPVVLPGNSGGTPAEPADGQKTGHTSPLSALQSLRRQNPRSR
jgi:hypothetical protein